MRALVITNSITRRDQKSLEKYLNDISKYDVLTPEEEVKLFKEFRNGNELAMEKIVRHNLRFVVSVAKQYQHLGLWLGDLINEGNIGLIKACRRFDETKGFKFISYAVWWIRQSILQAVNERSRKIRIPLNQQSNAFKILKKMEELLQKNERQPSLAELAAETGFTEEVVKKCLENYQKCRSLDAPIDEEGDHALINVMEDQEIESPDHDMVVRETQRVEVQQLLATLPPRTASVISMYYGIGMKHPMTLNDIGENMGLSRERIRQIINRGLRKLRTKSVSSDFTLN